MGSQLGGSGDLKENLFTCPQAATNNSWMKRVENQKRIKIEESGNAALYFSTPIYLNQSDAKPSAVIMQVYMMNRATAMITPFCSVVIPSRLGRPGDVQNGNKAVTDYVQAKCKA